MCIYIVSVAVFSLILFQDFKQKDDTFLSIAISKIKVYNNTVVSGVG